jgi:hypothetical protein
LRNTFRRETATVPLDELVTAGRERLAMLEAAIAG